MKAFKNITLYLLIMIFIILLTSSFQMDNFINENLTKLSLNSDDMRDLFYYTSKTDINIEEESNTDTLDNTEQPEAREWSLGDSGEEIFKYEKILYYLDYKKSKPTGNFGDEMVTAVKEFQEFNELEPSGTLDKTTIELLSTYPISYTLGKEGDEIKKYQLILYYLDYLKTYPEGIYGDVTVSAVEKYQRDNDLTESGEIDPETQEKLNEEELIYKSGKEGDIIKEYQTILNSLGYFQYSPDGQYGTNTTKAVQDYQNNNDLTVTGNIDSTTQEALKRPLEQQGRK